MHLQSQLWNVPMSCDMNDTWSQELRGQFYQNTWICFDYNAGGL